MDEFIIPVGIDGEGITEGFEGVYRSLDKLTANAEEAGAAISQTFTTAGADADELTKRANDAAAAFAKNKKVVQDLEKELAKYKDYAMKAHDPKIINDNIKKIADLETKIQSLTKANDKFGDSAQEAFTQAADGLEDVNAALDVAKQKLATLDPGSSDFKKLSDEIKAAEISMGSLNGGSGEYEEKLVSLKKQLREMTVALAAMKAEGLDNTEVYKNLISEAGELRDTIGDVQEEIALAGSDTSGIDNVINATQALAGAFGIVEGAEALFGVESEEMQKTLVKLNAVMAIMSGLQAVQAELARADSLALRGAALAQKLYALAVGTSTGAMKAFRVALLATGIGAFIVLLGVAAEYFSSMGDAADDAAEAVDRLNATFDVNGKSMQDYIDKNNKLTTLAVANAKARGASEKEVFEIEQNNRRKNAIYIQQEIDIDQQRARDKKLSAQELAAINANIAANQKKLFEANIDGQVAQAEATAEANKKALDSAKDAAQKNKQLQTERIKNEKEADDKLISLREQLAAAQLATMSEGLAKQELLIQQEYKNKIAEIQREMQLENERIALNKNTSAKELKAVADANKVRLGLVLQLQENEQKELADARFKFALDTAKMEVQYQKDLADLQKDSTDKTIQLIRLDAEERINAAKETYKDFPEKYAKIEKAIFESRDKLIKDAIAQSVQNEINAREQGQIKILESLVGYGKDEAHITALRENLIKKAQADAAKERYAELIKEYDKGGVLLLDHISEQFSNENIKAAAGKGIDIFELLGVDFSSDLTPEQLNAAKLAFAEAIKQYKDAIAPIPKEQKLNEFYRSLFGVDKEDFEGILDSTKQAVTQILDVYSSFLKERIELKQKEVDSLNEKIDEAQSSLDKELELQKEGYASNVKNKQAEVDALKAERDRALVEQKKAQKEEAKVAIATQAVQFASSVSSMISAAANIIEQYSSIPFVGWALGVAAAGSMFAGFLGLRASIKNYQSLETGGEIGGKRHSQGGNKYRSIDGNNEIIEIEKGEWITNRKQTSRRRPLLEAINKGASDAEIRNLLSGTGAMLSSDAKKQSLSDYNASEKIQQNYYFNASRNPYSEARLADIAQHTKVLADAERNKEAEYMEGDFLVRKKGNNIRRIKVKP